MILDIEGEILVGNRQNTLEYIFSLMLCGFKFFSLYKPIDQAALTRYNGKFKVGVALLIRTSCFFGLPSNFAIRVNLHHSIIKLEVIIRGID